MKYHMLYVRGVISVTYDVRTYVRTYVRTEKWDTLLYTNIRLSTNDQLIFLPSAKRGVDKKSGCTVNRGTIYISLLINTVFGGTK